MFDIGFWELSIIAVVALLVVGPERLPGMARTVGLYAGKLRRWVSQVRGEVERELRAEEIRQAMREAEKSEFARGVKESFKADEVKEAFQSAGSALKDAADADRTTSERKGTAATDASGASPAAATGDTASAPPAAAGPDQTTTAGDTASDPSPAGNERERGAG